MLRASCAKCCNLRFKRGATKIPTRGISASLATDDAYAAPFLEKFPVSIQETEKFGRAVFAKRDIKRGEIVLQEQPFLTSDPERCHEVTRALLSLPGLEKVPKTKAMLAFLAEALAYTRFSSSFPISPLDLAPMNLLRGAKSEILEVDAELLRKLGMVRALGQIFEFTDHPLLWNDEIFIELFQRIKTNQYEDGLYGIGSMFNHSCYRNCCWDFRSPFSEESPNREVIIALDNIKEGTQLFMSYSTDYETLKNGYGIPCTFDKENPEKGLLCSCAIERQDQDFVAKFHFAVHNKKQSL